MQVTTRVAVIGGGVVGCSILYHLTKLGWSDVILLERSELTSGSTWHAAGGFHTLNGDTNMAALQGYTIKLYRELEKLTGLSCGLHHVGAITLADNQDRFDMLAAERAKHRYMGLETTMLGPDEIAKIAPITNTKGVIGGLYDPLDGHLDPSGTTLAYAKAARMGGAKIKTKCKVLETNQRTDGTWNVVTEIGTIHAEHVVNAAGLWAREVGEMAGIYFPLLPMEHQYLITDEVPEIKKFIDEGKEHPGVTDLAGESYLRQEGRGLCIGFYEQKCRPWSTNGTPWDFGQELLPDDFEKIEDSIAFAYKRFPALERAGIKSVIHGPFTFAPDGNPLVGPVPGMRNYWAACAVMAGFSQGGGVGLSLAQWMVEGEPERDVFAMDCSRFGKWITPGYTIPKVIENYQRRFSITFPNEELPAARGIKRTPMYETFSNMGAVWGADFGLEVPNYFALKDEPDFETPSFRRSNAWNAIAREVKAVRSSVGINEVHNFSKFLVTGSNAKSWLDRIMAGKIPSPGRLALNPMLSKKGKLIGDFTVSCITDEKFQLIASYSSQDFHNRWFMQNKEDGVHIENISDHLNGFQIAGPKATEVLRNCSTVKVDNIKFLDVLEVVVGSTKCLLQKVSYTGDDGFELYCDPLSQQSLWNTLWAAGKPHKITPFGMRAMMSLRLDRFFGSWMSEYSPDYTAAETGLDRFIDFKKSSNFIGRSVAEAERITPPKRQLVVFEVDAIDADVVAYEPVFINDEVQGYCTSGGFSHHSRKSVAFALVPRKCVTNDLEVKIEILGKKREARRLIKPLL